MSKTIGWWTFDAETPSLVNRISGQRVRFEGIDGGGPPPSPVSGPVRLRFAYEDAKPRYPVLSAAPLDPR